jgi:hypothetical protein
LVPCAAELLAERLDVSRQCRAGGGQFGPGLGQRIVVALQPGERFEQGNELADRGVEGYERPARCLAFRARLCEIGFN